MVNKSTLSEGEYIVLNLRTHVKALFLAALVFFIVLGGGAFAATKIPDGSTQQWGRLGILVVSVVVIFAWSLLPFMRWATTRYVVTNRRLITRSGIITRIGRDIPLYRINDVAYEKGLLDRMLGCGTIVISDATEKAGVILHDVPHIERVQVQLHDLLFAADDGSDDGEFPPGEPRRKR